MNQRMITELHLTNLRLPTDEISTVELNYEAGQVQISPPQDGDVVIKAVSEAADSTPPELPSWDEAPDWANYRAVNSLNQMWWCEQEPTDGFCGLLLFRGGRKQGCRLPQGHRFEKRIEARPAALPSWDEAPDWANYLAISHRGGAFWEECEPEFTELGSVKYTARWRRVGTQQFPHFASQVFRRPFTPPWDKIDSPFDEYQFYDTESAGHFVATDDDGWVTTCRDVWSAPEAMARRKVGKVYTRPMESNSGA